MKNPRSTSWSGTLVRSIALGAVAGMAVTTLLSALGSSTTTSPAHADASLAVTATAAQQDPDVATAPFPDLAVTVSQTTGLTSQGVTVSWTGGKRSTLPSGDNGGANFLQIAQCWGEDPKNPGHPDRTTCQYGAFGTAGATRDGYVTAESVAPEDAQYTVPGSGVVDPYTSIPFNSVTKETVASVVNGKKVATNVNVNAFFGPYSSNEVPWAGSDGSGNGSVKFEVQTNLQAYGLGCGLLTPSGSSTTPQSCWLVVIPRGASDPGEGHITKSGLRWDAWKHNIAFKLSFNPIGDSCAIGVAERQLRGSELLGAAIASWQPVLCNAQGGGTFTMSNSAESDATAAANTMDNSPLALTSRPLTSGDTDSLTYAPVAVGGLAIAFAVDHFPSGGTGVPQEQLDKSGLSFGSMKLTPRLVAKLLTSSYLDALPTNVDKGERNYHSPADPGHNARNLIYDPDFQAVNADNPDWKYQAIASASVADLLVPQGRSDAAWQLWRYVLADPEAVSFLAGTPDPYGMIVNPNSSTSATVNPSKVGLTLPRDDFPKSDPIEQAPLPGNAGGPVNLVTWRPYTNDLDQAAYNTLRGDGQTLGPWDPVGPPPKYGKSVRNRPGNQSVLAVTDTSSAAKYQVITAQLQNAAGAFVAPTADAMAAAAAVMTPVPSQKQVLEYDPAGAAAKSAPTAYPLTMPVYAAANPALGDAAMRADYAAFIRYAATTGQMPGVAAGQLPPGYTSIPAAWKAQALGAASAIQAGAAPTSDTGSSAPSADAGAPAVPAASVDTTGPAASPSSTATVAPVASGVAAGLLTAGKTAKDPAVGAMPAIVPGGLVGGALAAFAAPIIRRLRRFP